MAARRPGPGRRPGTAHRQGPEPTPQGPGGAPYPVFVLDLVVALPCVVAVGVLLLRGRVVGTPLAVVVLVKIVTLFTVLWAGVAVQAMTDVPVHLEADAGPSALLLAVSGWLTLRWLGHIRAGDGTVRAGHAVGAGLAGRTRRASNIRRGAEMKALRLRSWQSGPAFEEVPVPSPGTGEVLVRVGGAGACHSDLHLMYEFPPGTVPWTPPFTLGHENAGWVQELGGGVDGLEVGQPVAVVGAWGCGRCSRCRAGFETYCDRPDLAPVPGGGGGLGLDGGMAEFLLVPAARHLVSLPDGLDPVRAAPLTDAGLTPYHAVRRSREKLTPGAAALVIGVGGLGHLGIQVLRATTGARVIAVDSRESARQLARRSGADLVVAPGESAHEEIREATHGLGADVVLDFVGSDETLGLAARSVRMLGDLTIVGLGAGTLPVSFFGIPYEVSVQTTYWATAPSSSRFSTWPRAACCMRRSPGSSWTRPSRPTSSSGSGVVNGRVVVVPHRAVTETTAPAPSARGPRVDVRRHRNGPSRSLLPGGLGGHEHLDGTSCIAEDRTRGPSEVRRQRAR